MATIPNRYYNSPWIEAAGRNLASALAPPDPDELRAREQKAFEFDYLKKKVANEDTDRTNTLASRVAIGKMYDLQRNPIKDASGKIDEKATERAAFGFADEAMRLGPKDVRGEVDDALFNLSPQFARKKILQKAMIDSQSDKLTRSLAGALDQLRVGGGIRAGLQDDQQQFELERLDKLYGLRWNELKFKTDAAAKTAGQKPLTISKQIGQEILNGILRREHATGNKLTDEARFAILSEISQDTQATRDPYFSTQKVWNARFPQHMYRDAPTQEVQEPGMFDHWLGNTDPYLAPTGPNGPEAVPGTAPAAEGSNDLGTAATTEPVPAPDNPFVARGKAETEMEGLSRDASRAETARIPIAGATPPAPKNSAARGKSKASPIPVKTPAEAAKLPHGTWIIDTFGRVGQTK